MHLRIPSGLTAAAAAAAAAAPLLTTAVRQIRNQTTARNELLTTHLRLWSVKDGVPIVRDIKDPVVLGVKPATAEPGTLAPWNPPYVGRDADERLDAMLTFSQFVLIVGDSASGKSRTAFEVIQRKFADRAIIIPARRESLSALLNGGIEFRGVLVWLDDLDSYLGTDKFTLADLERLVGSGQHEVSVIATIRKAAYDRFDQEAAISERKLLSLAAQLTLHRQLTYSEQVTAERVASGDSMLGTVLARLAGDETRAYGLAEYLAAAPYLIRRFDNADDVGGMTIGVALVRAAVDWRRVGITRPIPKDALFELCRHYLPFDDAAQVDDDAMDTALRWATHKVIATSALLTEEQDGYRAFDYLLDYVETEARFLIPPKLLAGLRELVNPEEVPRVDLALREIYRQTGQEAALAAGVDMKVLAAAEAGGSAGSGSGSGPPGMAALGNYDPVAAMLSARGLLLPPDIANFTGRADVVERAFETLTSGHVHALTISGLGGVGKSAIAIHLAHRLRQHQLFEDLGVYVSLRDQDRIGVAPEDALADVVAAFGAPGHVLRAANLDHLVSLYHDVLTRRRMVFVLDDAVSQQQVVPLIPPPPNIAIVTTRFELQLKDAHRMVLDPMTTEESVVMLRSIVGAERIDSDPAGVETITQMIGDLPLAIRIIGANLREDPTASLSKIAAELRNYPTSLDNLSSRGLAVRATFDLSYRKLTAEQARAFRFLGLAPREGFTIRQAAALLDGSIAETSQVLHDLTSVSLLRETSPDQHEMHELLRVFALELSQEADTESQRREALQRLNGR